MKIAITGHTNGIGKELDLYYHNKGIETKTYSRSTGHDISDISVRNKIISETLDCDVFINNAYDTVGQTDIASRWFEEHKNSPHLLVNISSIAPIADRYISPRIKPVEYTDYVTQKNELDRISWNINFAGLAAKCINVSPALVDTDMAHPVYIKRFKENNTVISPNELATMIGELVDQYFNKKWFVPHVYLINNDAFIQ